EDALAREIEQYYQREDGSRDAQPLGVEALAEELGNRPRAGGVAEARDHALADHDPDVDAERVAECDPQRRHAVGVREPRQPEEGGAARGGGREGQREQQRAVAAAGGRKIVRARDAAAADPAERE